MPRAVLDSLTPVMWMDDSQVVDLHAVKEWAGDRPPGVHVTVTHVGTPEEGA